MHRINFLKGGTHVHHLVQHANKIKITEGAK